jgi:hypothetical protein
LLLDQTDGGARVTRVVLNRVGEVLSCASTSSSSCSFDDDSDGGDEKMDDTNDGTGFSDNSQMTRDCDAQTGETETECLQFLVKFSIIRLLSKYSIT